LGDAVGLYGGDADAEYGIGYRIGSMEWRFLGMGAGAKRRGAGADEAVGTEESGAIVKGSEEGGGGGGATVVKAGRDVCTGIAALGMATAAGRERDGWTVDGRLDKGPSVLDLRTVISQ